MANNEFTVSRREVVEKYTDYSRDDLIELLSHFVPDRAAAYPAMDDGGLRAAFLDMVAAAPDVNEAILDKVDDRQDTVDVGEWRIDGHPHTPRTDDMWLIYAGSQGRWHAQPWRDAVTAGTLVDPRTGEDMTPVGWTGNRADITGLRDFAGGSD